MDHNAEIGGLPHVSTIMQLSFHEKAERMIGRPCSTMSSQKRYSFIQQVLTQHPLPMTVNYNRQLNHEAFFLYFETEQCANVQENYVTSITTPGDGMFMFSLCSLLSEEPKPSEHQELISTLQEIVLKKKKNLTVVIEVIKAQFKNPTISPLQLLVRYFGDM